jgi:hypothetical protein
VGVRPAGVVVAVIALVAAPGPARAQPPDRCRFLCTPEFLIEPTWTIEPLARRHRIVDADGERTVAREHVFELVLAVDIPTKFPRLGFTSEAIWAPAADENEVELEFEVNLGLLQPEQTRGWVFTHLDIVDQFSPAERPGATSAYSHKLDLELDTAVAVFKWLPAEHVLKPLEIEVSLDYLVTGRPRRGDVIDSVEYLTSASPWSLSFVLVVPVAPR